MTHFRQNAKEPPAKARGSKPFAVVFSAVPTSHRSLGPFDQLRVTLPVNGDAGFEFRSALGLATITLSENLGVNIACVPDCDSGGCAHGSI